MHGDSVVHADADSGDFTVLSVVGADDPDSWTALDTLCRDAVVGDDVDQHLLEAMHIVADAGMVGQLDDRVAHKLPGAMPSDLAAAVHGDNGSSIDGQVLRFGAFASRVDGGMFKQEDFWSVRSGSHFIVDPALQVPSLLVINVVRGKAQPLEGDGHAPYATRRRWQVRIGDDRVVCG